MRTELGAEGKFIVSYIGTMGNAHGLETVIEAAANIADHDAPGPVPAGGRRRGKGASCFPGALARPYQPAFCGSAIAGEDTGLHLRVRRVHGFAQEERNLQDGDSQQDAGVHVLRSSGYSRGRRPGAPDSSRRPRREFASSRKIHPNWRRLFCVWRRTSNYGKL